MQIYLFQKFNSFIKDDSSFTVNFFPSVFEVQASISTSQFRQGLAIFMYLFIFY